MNAAVAVAAGFAVWLVTAFVKRSHWPQEVNMLIAAAVAAVVSLGVVLGENVWAGVHLDLTHWRDYATASFAAATLIYGVVMVRVPGIRAAATGLDHLLAPRSPTASTPSAATPPVGPLEASSTPIRPAA